MARWEDERRWEGGRGEERDDVCERIARSNVDAEEVEVKVENGEVTLSGLADPIVGPPIALRATAGQSLRALAHPIAEALERLGRRAIRAPRATAPPRGASRARRARRSRVAACRRPGTTARDRPVESRWDKRMIEDMAEDVFGVNEVQNHLRTKSFTERAADANRAGDSTGEPLHH